MITRPRVVIMLCAVGVVALVSNRGRRAPAPGGGDQPEGALGFDIGDDYQLANYTQLSVLAEARRGVGPGHGRRVREDLRRAADADGDRHVAREPRRARSLPEIARRLALAEGLNDEDARRLAAEGKAVVWIDARAARDRGRQRPGADRDGLSDGEPRTIRRRCES